MSKIVKNNTGSPVTVNDVGMTIPASGSYTVNPNEFPLWAASVDIATLITAGTLTINDGYNDLSIARGIDFMRHPDFALSQRFLDNAARSNGFTARNTQEAIEEARDSIGGKMTTLPEFFNNGSTKDKWLSLDGSFASSDVVGAVIQSACKLVGLTYSNSNAHTYTDVEIYKNGSLITTWQIRDKKTAYKTNMSLFSFVAGDRVSVFCRDYPGGTPSSVMVTMSFQSTSNATGEGGSAT